MKALKDTIIKRETIPEADIDPFSFVVGLTATLGAVSEHAANLKTRPTGQDTEKMREALIQLAAGAIASADCLDRKKWRWPEELVPPEVSR